MTEFRRAGLALASLAMMLGIALPSGQAAASSLRGSTSGPLCLNQSATTKLACFVADGSNQARISTNSSTWSSFTAIKTSSTYNGHDVYAFEDAHGNCIRGGQGNMVKVYKCDYADDLEQKWVDTEILGGSPSHLENYGHLGNYMGTTSTLDQSLVWYEGEFHGFDTTWDFYGSVPS